MSPLTPNGLIPHADFPRKPYEAVHSAVLAQWSDSGVYHEYSGAWNAVAFRFHGSVDAGTKFQKSLRDSGPHPAPLQRYQQEEALFSFFSNGFAAYEAFFYGLFAIGSFIHPAAFPLSTAKERQRISPSFTQATFVKAFPGDQILDDIQSVFDEVSYQQWRDTRNILTHRAAPGRRMYVGIGIADAPPVEWKLNELPLDAQLIPTHQAQLAQHLATVLTATTSFLAKWT
ncbi:MAG: hypothetical protein HEQ34_02195 [Sphingorhabdus sp.]|uniref:hypothetical protein n=1 Tax=Sphingorhabdus sp. TaxID=1902408 RepID=UPI0025FA0C5D|nr:hypothetical protein [Sphingorhabdus sp.]MCO4090748.1 hypothetical protein [Sphingorhabdus sp.]